ncbi:hypothetical protein G3T14_01280 [Methylobacterium sp. BTF04]|uniref:hypothetical protein n=1 Tax=Methylobacterium sp. BTF04 TaxID=2708300 RepID=UPI0013D84BF0|nr:hypothetical protein [Methylobacterium sp. BTF04]NEU10763.1 hypothetical protein [Methylobacterium sp. BTF04]
METTLILSALAVLVLSGILVATMVARSRRPELRMAREEDLAEDGEEILMRSIEPPRISPIDRSAPILDIEPVVEHDPVRKLPGGQDR